MEKKARRGPIARHVVARKDQMLVALPAEVRRALALGPGVEVWWHVVTKGEALLTATRRRSGGRPQHAEGCPSCAAYRDEIARLHRKLAEQPAAARRQAWFEVAQQKLRLELTGLPVMGAINTRLARMEDALANLQGSRFRRRRPPQDRPRRSEVVPAPILQEQKSELVTVSAAPGPE